MGVVREDKFIMLKKTDEVIQGDKAYVVINASQNERDLISLWS